MIPVKPALHERLKKNSKEMGKTLNDYVFFLEEFYKANTPL